MCSYSLRGLLSVLQVNRVHLPWARVCITCDLHLPPGEVLHNLRSILASWPGHSTTCILFLHLGQVLLQPASNLFFLACRSGSSTTCILLHLGLTHTQVSCSLSLSSSSFLLYLTFFLSSSIFLYILCGTIHPSSYF